MVAAQKAQHRRRQQLVSRANSLKKAIRQIIEHTCKRKIGFCYSCFCADAGSHCALFLKLKEIMPIYVHFMLLNLLPFSPFTLLVWRQ